MFVLWPPEPFKTINSIVIFDDARRDGANAKDIKKNYVAMADMDYFLARFEYDFNEVMDLARQKCFEFTTPKIMIAIDYCPSAFAIGNKNIIINSGLLQKVY